MCLPLAGMLAAFWGMMLGFPVLRLRGDYLAIVTLAFGEIIRIVLINWQSLTGGPNGIDRHPASDAFSAYPSNAAQPSFPASSAWITPPPSLIFLYYLILALALADQLGDAAAAPAADRPRLGGVARG